jgi:hypothetical protein
VNGEISVARAFMVFVYPACDNCIEPVGLIMSLLKMTFALTLAVFTTWLLSVFKDNSTMTWGLVMTAIILIIYSLVVGVFLDAAEAMTRLIEAATDWGRMYGKLDDDARDAIGGKFKPLVFVKWTRGRIEYQFEDTGVTIDVFRQFLQDSSKATTASRRDWVTRERKPKDYEAIYLWLVDHGHVIEGSDSGNQSYKWKTEWELDRLMGRYWMAGRKIADMSYKETEATG